RRLAARRLERQDCPIGVDQAGPRIGVDAPWARSRARLRSAACRNRILTSSGRPVWGVSSVADQGPSGAGALRPITALALLPRGDEADDLRLCLHLPDDLADLVLRQFGFGETDAVELAPHIQRSLDHRGLVGAEEVGDVVCGRLRGKTHDGIGAFAG